MSENKEKPEKPKRNKWLSTKWLLSLWSIFLITFIVIANRSEYKFLVTSLVSIPLGYIGANVFQKKIYADAEDEPENPESEV